MQAPHNFPGNSANTLSIPTLQKLTSKPLGYAQTQPILVGQADKRDILTLLVLGYREQDQPPIHVYTP